MTLPGHRSGVNVRRNALRSALRYALMAVAFATLASRALTAQDTARQAAKTASQPTKKKTTATTPIKLTQRDTTAADSAKRAAAKREAARRDSVRRDSLKHVGLLGPSSGDRHLSYRGMGSSYDSLWPPKMPAVLPGSILPAKRIVAFYGNPASQRMGILGEFEPDVMLQKLDAEVAEWNKLDPSHPVQPALHLIAVVAQASPGKDGKYRLRMDSSMIEKVYGWAHKHNALFFVDVQVGHSTLHQELPWLERFLIRPDVHLGIDPEFSMKNTKLAPGKIVGTYDAADINYAMEFLENLVDKYHLPPKVLVVHRFKRKSVTNYKDIKLDSRVQFVMDMDGFGAPWLKFDSYYQYIKKEPVQFAGWKQFSKLRNDNPPTLRSNILKLWPVPMYIQVQ